MLEISIAIVIIACIAGFLVNKFLDQKLSLNTKATEVAMSAALEERFNKFDERLNNTWSTISSTKQELEAYKLQMGIRNR